MRDKKGKETNKDVLGFMAEKMERVNKEKKEALSSNINKLAQMDLKTAPETTKPQNNSDKVPEFAKLVVDDEGLQKELMDLKRKLREKNLENIKVQSNIKLVERKKRETENILDSLISSKSLITVNGIMEVANLRSTDFKIRMEDIPDFDKLEKKENPLEPVVDKIAARGYTLEQCFTLFDENGDEILSKEEIKEGLKNQEIKLTAQEME